MEDLETFVFIMQTQTCHGLNLKNEAIEGSLFRYYGIGREKRRPMIPVVMSQVNPTPVGVKECPFHSTLSLDRDSESLSLMQTEQRITPGPSPISWRSLWDVSKIMRFGIHEAMLRFFETYGPICRSVFQTKLYESLAQICKSNQLKWKIWLAFS